MWGDGGIDGMWHPDKHPTPHTGRGAQRGPLVTWVQEAERGVLLPPAPLRAPSDVITMTTWRDH
jgi:hypothetical protein